MMTGANINLNLYIMGQYYRPVAIGCKDTVSPYDYGNGAKLMEHSWVGNQYVGAVEQLIKRGGPWAGKQIVWAGDYADSEKNRKRNLYQTLNNELKIEVPKDYHKQKRVLRYLKNLDTNEFVDLKHVAKDSDGWQMHPLPILTCEGNGRGGGDLHDDDEKIGKWARNRLVLQKSKPKNCAELVFDLVEN